MSEVWKQSENREIPPAEQNCVRERMDTTLYLVTDSCGGGAPGRCDAASASGKGEKRQGIHGTGR